MVLKQFLTSSEYYRFQENTAGVIAILFGTQTSKFVFDDLVETKNKSMYKHEEVGN